VFGRRCADTKSTKTRQKIVKTRIAVTGETYVLHPEQPRIECSSTARRRLYTHSSDTTDGAVAEHRTRGGRIPGDNYFRTL